MRAAYTLLPKCKHSHVLRGNTCRALPVKINHVSRGRRSFHVEKKKKRGGEECVTDQLWREIGEKGPQFPDPCQPLLFLPRAIQGRDEKLRLEMNVARELYILRKDLCLSLSLSLLSGAGAKKQQRRGMMFRECCANERSKRTAQIAPARNKVLTGAYTRNGGGVGGVPAFPPYGNTNLRASASGNLRGAFKPAPR